MKTTLHRNPYFLIFSALCVLYGFQMFFTGNYESLYDNYFGCNGFGQGPTCV